VKNATLGSAASAAAINHLLAREAWAREKLAPFAGRVIRFDSAPLPGAALRIVEGGTLQATDQDAVAELTLRIPPRALAGIALRNPAAIRAIEPEGDMELARAVQFLFENLRWEVEEDLSRLIGDVAAHRLGEAGRAFFAWQREAGERFAENVAEYWREERRVLVSPIDATRFSDDVNTLRDDIERLEKRIERLVARRKHRG